MLSNINKSKTLRVLRYYSTIRIPQLTNIGIKNNKIKYNLSYDELYRNEITNNEGKIFKTKYGNTFGIDTGKFTGRSPNDKWIVQNMNSPSNDNLWWGKVNKPIQPYIFDDLLEDAVNHFNALDYFYLYDGLCGANEKTQKKVRFVHEQAWQQHFVKNMFINIDTPTQYVEHIEPDFTIINACSVINNRWKEHNLNSEVAIAFNIEKKLGVILGTWYGGENKKGIFSLMNYWLPINNIMSMHCSANVGKDGDSALFFGLSATGKTTLSADPKRYLIGDDEHGWDDDGIFNFEGGCYAKTIDLEEVNEPEIYQAIKRDALLENVWMNEDGSPDYTNTTKTQNGRVSYPIEHIQNMHKPQCATHPKNIIFLTCDAFGILPPVARLSNGQAMYHFLSGYTAKIAGTERGITEPEATFSACFGEAFLTLHPTKYADLLENKIKEHNCNVYLVNTGWTGGSYGVGNRVSIETSRACVDAILTGDINDCEFCIDEFFNFEVPININNVPAEICIPKNTWGCEEDYNIQANKLVDMFRENFKKYIQPGLTNYSKYGPQNIQ